MALKIIDSSNLPGKDNPIFLEGTLPISKRKFADLGTVFYVERFEIRKKVKILFMHLTKDVLNTFIKE